MDKRASIIGKAAKAFDKARGKFVSSGDVLEFLSIGEGAEQSDETLSNDYVTEIEISGGWFPFFDKLRGSGKLQIATLDDSFGDALNNTSHVRFNNTVYKLAGGDDGRIAPTGDNLFWQVFYNTNQEAGF